MMNDKNATYRNYTCDDIRDLIGAYSIGATSPAETRAVEHLLPDCPEAAAELAEYIAVTDAMLHVLPMDKEPPKDLIGRLNLGTNPTKPVHHSNNNHHHQEPTLELVKKLQELPPEPQKSAPPRRNIALWLGLAAMFVLALGMNFVWYSLFQGLQSQQAQLNTLIANQQQMIEALDTAPAASPVILAGNNTHSITLNPATDTVVEAMARVVWDSSSNFGTLWVDGLPQPPSGHGYQMWLVQGGQEISLGKFSVGNDGQGTLLFQSPVPIAEDGVIGISMEPVLGSPQPTTPHLVTGEIGT